MIGLVYEKLNDTSLLERINQSIKTWIYIALPKQIKFTEARRLLQVGTLKKPWLKAIFKSLSIIVGRSFHADLKRRSLIGFFEEVSPTRTTPVQQKDEEQDELRYKISSWSKKSQQAIALFILVLADALYICNEKPSGECDIIACWVSDNKRIFPRRRQGDVVDLRKPGCSK